MSGPLGCGELEAFITDCDGNNAEQIDASQISWSRVEDGVSTASVTVPTRRTGGLVCVGPVTRAVPWRAELEIWRDGELVHAGPVVSRRERRDALSISSVDELGWASRRIGGLRGPDGSVIADRVMGSLPATDVARTAILDAIIGCSTSIAAPSTPTGQQSGATGSVTLRRTDPRPVDEALRDLLAASTDVTMVGRELRIVSQGWQPIVATLLDEHFGVDIETVEDGAAFADVVYVRGADGLSATWPMPYPATTGCCPVEVIVDRSDLKTQAAVNLAAQGEWAKRRGGMSISQISSVLLPDAPISIADLVPGNRVAVILQDRAWPIDQTMVISRVEGRQGTGSIDGASRDSSGRYASSSAGSGAMEQITVALRPYTGVM